MLGDSSSVLSDAIALCLSAMKACPKVATESTVNRTSLLTPLTLETIGMPLGDNDGRLPPDDRSLRVHFCSGESDQPGSRDHLHTSLIDKSNADPWE